MKNHSLCLCMISVSLILAITTSKIATAGVSTLKNVKYNFQIDYPAHWESNPDQQTNVLKKYDLTVLNYDQLKDSRISETRIYVLDNPGERKLDEFFLTKKKDSKEFIARQKKIYNGFEVMLVGYEYDPPKWKIISYEVEMMVALTSKTFVYIQISGTTSLDGDELRSIVENMLSSFRQ